MLRGNLSTRPFYNERLVHVALGLAALLVLAATAFNVQRLVSLTARERTLAAQITAADDDARALQQEAQVVRTGVDPAELQAVATRASEANTLIGQRHFSWTALFNRLETTIPDDVMLEAIQPKIDDGVTSVRMIVQGRNVAAIDAFIERLEQTGTFEGLLSVEEQLTDAGTYRATLEGQYWPDRGAAPAPGSSQPSAATADANTPAASAVDEKEAAR